MRLAELTTLRVGGEAASILSPTTSADLIEAVTQTWATGDDFTMADCAAAPALFYADKVAPLADKFPNTLAYLGRLKQRPCYARVLQEAEPFFKYFPAE